MSVSTSVRFTVTVHTNVTAVPAWRGCVLLGWKETETGGGTGGGGNGEEGG